MTTTAGHSCLSSIAPVPNSVRRRVEYRIYVGRAVQGDTVVSDLDVVECESEEVGSRSAIAHRVRCQQGAPFRKTVYVYKSAKFSAKTLFGFFVCKTKEPTPSVFVNFNAIDDLSSKKPICEMWLRSDSINADTL